MERATGTRWDKSGPEERRIEGGGSPRRWELKREGWKNMNSVLSKSTARPARESQARTRSQVAEILATAERKVGPEA